MSDHRRPRDCVAAGHVSETHSTMFDTHACCDCGGEVPCELVPDLCRIGELQATLRSLRRENQRLRKLGGAK
jgi:hypothetical protein